MIRITIFKKFFFSLLLLSAVVMSVMTIQINRSFKHGLQDYLNQNELNKVNQLAKLLAQYYSPDTGWQALKLEPRLWDKLFRQIGEIPPPPPRREEPLRDKPLRTQHGIDPLSFRVALYSDSGKIIEGRPRGERFPERPLQEVQVDILVENKVVGRLSVTQSPVINDELANSFYLQQQSNIYWISFFAAISSFLVAAALLGRFLKPLTSLQDGAKALTSGDYDHQVEVVGNDELADLSEKFNQLAFVLKQQKETREQWISDISHELRTPITVLRAEIEAVEDGIRKPTPEVIHSLHDQVLNLSKLVDDLYQLSLSDTGISQDLSDSVDLKRVINQLLTRYRLRFEEKNIEIVSDLSIKGECIVTSDEKLLNQLFF